MEGERTDISLLTSAIGEDLAENPNSDIPQRSETYHHHHHHHPHVKVIPKKTKEDQNGPLLADFDEVINYVDYFELTQKWLSRIFRKSDTRIFLLTEFYIYVLYNN